MDWNIKVKKKLINSIQLMRESVKKNFRFATLDCIFILLFISTFSLVFGASNSIVGVIFAVLMGVSLQSDFTNASIKHFCIMTVVMILMCVAACYVSILNPYIALPINLLVCFIILYSYTYEYSSSLYFPYILSYLFLVFITPIQPIELPVRLISVLVGCLSVFIYHFVLKRNKSWKSIGSAINEIIDIATDNIRLIISNETERVNEIETRKQICKLSRLIYDRRKSSYHISDAAFAAIDAARGLENLTVLLNTLTADKDSDLLKEIRLTLDSFKDFLSGKTTSIAPIAQDAYRYNETTQELYTLMEYIRVHLLRMSEKDKRKRYRKSSVSLLARIRSVVQFSSVRFIYALRVAVLLSLFTMVVQILNLPHGKWLLFTIASVSLPCADDVASKAYKRLFATLVGGIISFVLFSAISNPTLRTLIMTLSGYFSFYFADYKTNYACATVGALGGAMFATSFGVADVGMMVGIRLGYIVIGILIAVITNRVVFPIKSKRINQNLMKKYTQTTTLLTTLCAHEHVDAQIYYNLVIQSNMMEESLIQYAEKENQGSIISDLKICRSKVRTAHRKTSFNTTSLEYL